MPLLSQGRGGLLSALQVRDKNLLDIGIGEHLGETFGALVSGIAEQRIGRVGNFVRVPHNEDGAHGLRMRVCNAQQYEKPAEDRKSESCFHGE